jgi:O-antigen/teichoic acid export membrane protein
MMPRVATAAPGALAAATLTRRVLSGALHLTLSNAVVRLLPFVTIPILTRALSPQAYGVASLLTTTVSLVAVVSLAGIDMSYARAYHSAYPPSGDTVEHYCWRVAFVLAAISSVVAGAAWWLSAGAGTTPTSRTSMAILLSLGIAGTVTGTMAQTRARLLGRYRALAVTIVLSGIAVSATSTAIALWWRQDALALIVPFVLTYLLPILVLGVPSIASLRRRSRLSRDAGTTLFKIGIGGVITAPMYWMLSSADRWFLQHYRGAEAVGIYSIGYNAAVVGTAINAAVMSVWLPEASREFERDREHARTTLGTLMVRLTAVMAVAWLAAAAAGGDIIRWLAHERFHEAAGFVPYIALGVFFYGAQQFAAATLVLVKRFKWATVWWAAGGVVSAILNLLLVPKYGGAGAAVAQSASFGFVLITMFVVSQASYRIEVSWRRLLAAFAVVGVAGLAMARPWHECAPLSLLAKLPFGIAVAVLVSWATAPDWCTRAIRMLRDRRSP